MTPFKHLWAVTMITILLVAGAIYGYWYFLDGVWNPPLVDKMDSAHVLTTQTTYHYGDDVYAIMSYCKYRAIPVTVAVEMVDGQVITLSATENNLPIGCYGVDKSFIGKVATVPRGIATGKWHLEWTVTYHINPIKDIVYKRRSVDFQVI